MFIAESLQCRALIAFEFLSLQGSNRNNTCYTEVATPSTPPPRTPSSSHVFVYRIYVKILLDYTYKSSYVGSIVSLCNICDTTYPYLTLNTEVLHQVILSYSYNSYTLYIGKVTHHGARARQNNLIIYTVYLLCLRSNGLVNWTCREVKIPSLVP